MKSRTALLSDDLEVCPLGLNCGDYESNCRHYCHSLARAWSLPMVRDRFLNAWIVTARRPLYEADTREAAVDLAHAEAGYFAAIPIPYRVRDDGALVVVEGLTEQQANIAMRFEERPENHPDWLFYVAVSIEGLVNPNAWYEPYERFEVICCCGGEIV